MKLNRRSVLASLAFGGLVGGRSSAQIGVDNEVVSVGDAAGLIDIEGMERLDALPSEFGKPDYQLSPNYGSKQPPEFYSKIARIIMRGAPIKCRPVDVARYFYDVRTKNLTDTVRDRLETLFANQSPKVPFSLDFVSLFGYDWERDEYYNPLVVNLIVGTKTEAYDGDVTPWCASFANWCIARSQATRSNYIAFDDLLDYGTKSAASGSFRCWGSSTEEPSYGDLIVYAKRGTENQTCPVNLNNAQGHVGFYVGQRLRANGSTAYDVLGGNQGFAALGSPLALGSSEVTTADIAQAVSIRSMGAAWSNRVLHSFRTSSILKG